MNGSPWHRESCKPGREYQLAANIHIKYDDQERIISRIIDALKQYIKVDAAVRLNVDTPLSEPARAILAIPFDADIELILSNFASTIFQSLMGYYISADPKTSHFGIANSLIEGDINSLVRREIEKLFQQFRTRDDMAGRLLRNVRLVADNIPEAGSIYFTETLQKGLDIHIGYRLIAFGDNLMSSQMFIPITAGKELIDMVYYNLEQIIHHNFVAYDEAGDNYLKVTDVLIYKELVSLIERAKKKENTRKKILNNLQFTTVFTEDPVQLYGAKIGDALYDTINRVQQDKLSASSDRSRELFATCMIRATEITTSGIDVDTLEFEEKPTHVPAPPEDFNNIKVPAREEKKEEEKVETTTGIKEKLSIQRDSFQEL